MDPLPFARDVVAFPTGKPNNLQFPHPECAEVQNREEHIPDHLPLMYPTQEGKVKSVMLYHVLIEPKHLTFYDATKFITAQMCGTSRLITKWSVLLGSLIDWAVKSLLSACKL